jgi:hypothetical protein
MIDERLRQACTNPPLQLEHFQGGQYELFSVIFISTQVQENPFVFP